MSSFDQIPMVETQPETPRTTYQFITKDGPESTMKVGTSIFKDLSGMLPTLLCVGFVVIAVVIIIIFVVPIISNIFSDGSAIVNGVESDVKDIVVTAADLAKDGIDAVITIEKAVATVVSEVLCWAFHIECNQGSRWYTCCELWDPYLISKLLEKGVHINAICSHGDSLGWAWGPGGGAVRWTCSTQVPANYMGIYNLYANNGAGNFPPDESVYPYMPFPFGNLVRKWLTKPDKNAVQFFQPAISAGVAGGARYPIYWQAHGLPNPTN